MTKSASVLFTVAVIFSVFLVSPAFAENQDIIKLGADINIPKGMTVRDVVAIGGNVTVSGRVEQDVIAVGGSVTLMANSYVGREIVVVGGKFMKDASAQVKGETSQVYMPHFLPSFMNVFKGGWLAVWVAMKVLALLGFLGLAVLLIALMPAHLGSAAAALERSFAAMLIWGILWMILIVPIAVLLAISIVGIVLIPIEVLIAALAMILGYIVAGMFVGKKIFLSLKRAPLPFADAIAGILLLAIVSLVPFIGALVIAVFLVAGFGAVLTTRFGTR